MRILTASLTIAVLAVVLAAWNEVPRDARADDRPDLRERRLAFDQAESPFVPQEIVVRFREGASRAAIAQLNGAHGARTLDAHPHSRLHRLQLPEGANVEQVAAAYNHSPLVEEAGPNFVVRAMDAPNDTNYSHQWHLHNTTGGMWAEAAWDLSVGQGQGAVVAVIDTGVAYEDFGPFSQAPDLDGTTFVAPKDYVEDDGHPNDDNGHGSHVAGTISQDTNDAWGVAGVAFNSSIMPVKVLAQDGSGSGDDLVEAIYYAVDNGSDVINMSLGFSGTGSPDGSGEVCTEIVGLNDALEYAYANGVVVVAAAGNDGGITVTCPAAYPTVIAVGALGYDGQRVSYSNTGAALDVTAPGGNPNTDLNGDGFSDGVLQETFCFDWATMYIYYVVYGINLYGEFCDVFYSGTSMASPHVAGTAALLLAADPALTVDQVRFYIQATARDRGASGWDPEYGSGALDAYAALFALTGGATPTPIASPTPTPAPTPTATPTPTPTPTPTTPTPTPTTPTPTPTPSPTPTATPTPAPASTLHVGDLDGSGVKLARGTWKAVVTVSVHDSSEGAVAEAVVSGTFHQNGVSAGPLSCTTGPSGSCSIDSGTLPSKEGKATFVVDSVVHGTVTYDESVNHDPDSDSNGTEIALSK